MILECRNCELCKNQEPMIDVVTSCDVMWVGISAKMINFEDELPLDSRTYSEKLLREIEKLAENVTFYKTNIVKCPPLKKGKLVYPSKENINDCFPNFQKEIDRLKPKVIFILGKENSNHILGKYDEKIDKLDEDFNYIKYNIGRNILIPIHHPSYISVYKRKLKDKYIENIVKIINESNL